MSGCRSRLRVKTVRDEATDFGGGGVDGRWVGARECSSVLLHLSSVDGSWQPGRDQLLNASPAESRAGRLPDDAVNQGS